MFLGVPCREASSATSGVDIKLGKDTSTRASCTCLCLRRLIVDSCCFRHVIRRLKDLPGIKCTLSDVIWPRKKNSTLIFFFFIVLRFPWAYVCAFVRTRPGMGRDPNRPRQRGGVKHRHRRGVPHFVICSSVDPTYITRSNTKQLQFHI